MELQHTLINSFSKRLWKLLRLVLITLRKMISRSSRLIWKRVKIAAISNRNKFHSRRYKYPLFAEPRLAYEFSCNNSPAYFNIKKWPRLRFLSRGHYRVAPPSQKELEEILGRMLMGGCGNYQHMAVGLASPALPGFGFGRSPAVRQLRITDSPFPVNYVDENNHIDEDAEKFIAKFYKDLLNQTVY